MIWYLLLGLTFSTTSAFQPAGKATLQAAVDDCANNNICTVDNSHISDWDVSLITDMNSLFFNRQINPDITKWDVSNVQSFAYMFGSNHVFNQDISCWDVSSGTDFERMFMSTDAFNKALCWDIQGKSQFAMFSSSGGSVDPTCTPNCGAAPTPCDPNPCNMFGLQGCVNSDIDSTLASDAYRCVSTCYAGRCQHGVCTDSTNGHTCTCDAGYSGTNCEINECDPDPCQNGAICTGKVGGYECECVEGYSGTNCETNVCDPNPCQNGAICTGKVGGYECECVEGYSGTNCETNVCDSCQNGVCTVTQGYECTCDAGYSGTNCETNVCDPNPCQNGAICTGKAGGYECECVAGYSGTNCETNECDSCQNGNCTGKVGGYTCNCTVGYTGKDCDTLCQCENGATCVDSICICTPAYEGTLCEINKLDDSSVFAIEQTLTFNSTVDESQLRQTIADLFEVEIEAVTIKSRGRRLSSGVTFEIRTQDAETLEKVNTKMKQTAVLKEFFESPDIVLVSASEPTISEACENECSGSRNLDCTCSGSPVGFIVTLYALSVLVILLYKDINQYNYL